jgi:transcriptional regulator with XRE-family HTH domain
MNSTMVGVRSDEQRRALSAFLRAQREGASPAEFGLAAGARRRTPGLRREEVAQLCGLSVTWYTWIEQGRDMSVSPAALARLARGLRLARAERAYLFSLAEKTDPDRDAGEAEDVPGAVLACVDAIEAPAYILDRWWSARRWNAKAGRLFVGWLDAAAEPNLLRYIFLRPEARTLICNWEERARRVAAEFRASSSAHVTDARLRQLVETLHRESAEFARFWRAHGVLEREGGERTFNHPVDGFLSYRHVSLDITGWPDFKLAMLLPNPAR